MKKVITLATIGMMALAIMGTQINLHAQESKGSAAGEKAAATKPKTLPFNGTLKAVDQEAGTVKVGNRTFKLTADSKYLQGSLSTAKVGEKVGGSYWKGDDGTLIVNSIRIGPKPEKKKTTSADQ